MNFNLFPGKSTKERIIMKEDKKYGLTWQDFLFGLTGSTLFVVMLYFITG